MASLIADKSSFVAVGAWNPSIFQPDWLFKEFPEIVPESLPVELVGHGNIRFDFGDFYLQALNDRLLLTPKETLNENVLQKISSLAKGIHDRLKYTPLIAVGSNFFFELSKDEKFTSEDIESLPIISNLPAKLENTQLISRSIKHTLSQDELNVNIHYDITGNQKSILMNFERKSIQHVMIKASDSLIDDYNCAFSLSNSLIIKG